MLSERMLTNVVRAFTGTHLRLKPFEETLLPAPVPGRHYMLYAHIPFCERLCPYCSFNRFPFQKTRAERYFDSMRKEMRMLADLGYDFDSLYIGGGTPTVMMDELCATIDLAREIFSVEEVSSETNPNHLTPEHLDQLAERVQRLSVGVQSSNNDLLKQMDRYDKYGSAEEIFVRLQRAVPYFKSLNADMIFNFPAQTEDILIDDLAFVLESGVSQATFYPLMVSSSVERSLRKTVGEVSYDRERAFYEIICDALLGSGFSLSSAWTFDKSDSGMIDEYVVDYEEYPAIGSGGITYLGDSLFVNTFSLDEYSQKIDSGRMSIMGKSSFGKRDRMRYRFMMQLFGLQLDKSQFKRDFGCSVEQGLPVEMAFMRACGAFDRDDSERLTLSRAGRYLLVAMMRQFFIGVNDLRDQARAALPENERALLFGDGCCVSP